MPERLTAKAMAWQKRMAGKASAAMEAIVAMEAMAMPVEAAMVAVEADANSHPQLLMPTHYMTSHIASAHGWATDW